MITLDPGAAVPPSEQIRQQLEDSIRSGALPAGQRLPAIRQLAADLRVAAGTVAKAYAALDDAGLLETGRARGTRVAAGGLADARVRAAATALIAATPGASLDELLGAVRSAWQARP